MTNTNKSATITINASKYADHDDCLSAAADDYADEHGLEGWDLEPRWGDDNRETILLTVPAHARRVEILSALRKHDHGDGCLGIIVDQALADDPDVTIDEVRAIVVQAERAAARAEGDE